MRFVEHIFAIWGAIAAALVAYNLVDTWQWKRNIKRAVRDERRRGAL